MRALIILLIIGCTTVHARLSSPRKHNHGFNCQRTSSCYCNKKFTPMCAYNKYNKNRFIQFDNICEYQFSYFCRGTQDYSHWENGVCPGASFDYKRDTPGQTQFEEIYKRTEIPKPRACSFPCPRTRAPVCGFSPHRIRKRTFDNMCLMEKFNSCTFANGDYKLLHEGDCGYPRLFEDKMPPRRYPGRGVEY